MTGKIIPFPRVHRVVTAIDQVFDDLDSFGKLIRTGKRPLDSIAAVESLDIFGYPVDLPCDVEPTENNLRPDGTKIITTEETREDA